MEIVAAIVLLGAGRALWVLSRGKRNRQRIISTQTTSTTAPALEEIETERRDHHAKANRSEGAQSVLQRNCFDLPKAVLTSAVLALNIYSAPITLEGIRATERFEYSGRGDILVMILVMLAAPLGAVSACLVTVYAWVTGSAGRPRLMLVWVLLLSLGGVGWPLSCSCARLVSYRGPFIAH